MFRALNTPQLWIVTLSAAGILMVTMGARQSLGLFLAPLNASTGLGIASISLAMAIGQFIWGPLNRLPEHWPTVSGRDACCLAACFFWLRAAH